MANKHKNYHKCYKNIPRQPNERPMQIENMQLLSTWYPWNSESLHKRLNVCR